MKMKLKIKKSKIKNLSKNEKALPLNATPQVAGAGTTVNISQANVVGGSCGWLGCVQA
jgi:hypothetical protein